MLIAIDVGNSRLKFGVRASGDPVRGDWLHVGALETQDTDALARTFAALAAGGLSGTSAPPQAIVSNVAGEKAAASIARALSVFSSNSSNCSNIRWVCSPAQQLGVANGYAEPDSTQRLLDVHLHAGFAIFYWEDFADRHVKILHLRRADA